MIPCFVILIATRVCLCAPLTIYLVRGLQEKQHIGTHSSVLLKGKLSEHLSNGCDDFLEIYVSFQ